ncbi:MAG: DUF58 domain-containing protein [Acidobacteriota bacterium]
MPALRVFYLLGVTTLLGVVGVLVPWAGWTALGLDALLLAAVWIDWRRARAVRLDAERHWPRLLTQGTPATLRLEIEGPEVATTVRLRETLHPGLTSTPARAELRLLRRAAWEIPLEPARRGEHSSGPLMARVLGPWGLAWHQRELVGAEPRKVYPQVRWDGKVGQLLLLAHRRALGQHPQRHRGLGTEPYALREYLAGDPPNKIHWKASARHGRLVSREDTWERGARLVVLLDCGRGMSGEDGERAKLDHALAAALALARVAAARGDRVTITAFSDRIERTVRLTGGVRRLQTAYAQLYDLQARLVEPAFDLAADTAVALESRRSTVVLFTSVVDLAAADWLRRAVLKLERRHRPVLLNLQDPELLALADSAPATPRDAFAQAAALDIGLANRDLATRLRRTGVRVVNAPADRLALEALEAYLSIFGAG